METNNWLTPQVILQAVVAITVLVTFFWKVPSKGDIKSLKTDIEGNIKSLKTDIEGNIKSLKIEIKDDIKETRADLRQANQNFTDHLNLHINHPSAKNEIPHEYLDQSLKDLITPQKGEFSYDEHVKHTGP